MAQATLSTHAIPARPSTERLPIFSQAEFDELAQNVQVSKKVLTNFRDAVRRSRAVTGQWFTLERQLVHALVASEVALAHWMEEKGGGLLTLETGVLTLGIDDRRSRPRPAFNFSAHAAA